MDVENDARREPTLVIEHGTRTALVDGERIELSPTDFALLAALATSPGEVIPVDELMEEVYGVPMAPQDLRYRIWRLRDFLGDREREHKIIGNRRGQGYFLALDPEAVEVTDRYQPATEVRKAEAPKPQPTNPEPQPLSSPETPAPALPIADEEQTTGEVVELESIPSRKQRHRLAIRPGSVLVASLAGLLALGGSWSVGYLLATKADPRPPVQNVSELPRVDPSPSPSPEKEKKEPDGKGQKKQAKKSQRNKRPRKNKDRPGGPSEVAVAAAPPASTGEAANPGNPAPDPNPQPKGGKDSPESKPQPVAPALPAAPTRYLYHLINAETGDHFVTTDSNTASEYEAQGYSGGAIARVYTSEEAGTRPLTTNHGTAWIFVDDSPRTEPSSRVVALWYATDNKGDFFYTTSKSEATASGWSGTLAGYVRTL